MIYRGPICPVRARMVRRLSLTHFSRIRSGFCMGSGKMKRNVFLKRSSCSSSASLPARALLLLETQWSLSGGRMVPAPFAWAMLPSALSFPEILPRRRRLASLVSGTSNQRSDTTAFPQARSRLVGARPPLCDQHFGSFSLPLVRLPGRPRSCNLEGARELPVHAERLAALLFG